VQVKRIVEGVLYDTEQATLIAENRYDGASDDDDYTEALYRNANGVLFLAAEGGVESFYGAVLKGGKPSRGYEIIPLTASEARRWLEDHDHMAEIEALFGPVPQAGEQAVSIDFSVPPTLKSAIDLAAAKDKQSVNDWLTRLVEQELNGATPPKRG
jgi:hypothetical protein